jgi:hypothetical protein
MSSVLFVLIGIVPTWRGGPSPLGNTVRTASGGLATFLAQTAGHWKVPQCMKGQNEVIPVSQAHLTLFQGLTCVREFDSVFVFRILGTYDFSITYRKGFWTW